MMFGTQIDLKHLKKKTLYPMSHDITKSRTFKHKRSSWGLGSERVHCLPHSFGQGISISLKSRSMEIDSTFWWEELQSHVAECIDMGRGVEIFHWSCSWLQLHMSLPKAKFLHSNSAPSEISSSFSIMLIQESCKLHKLLMCFLKCSSKKGENERNQAVTGP